MGDRLVSSMHSIVKKGWSDDSLHQNTALINDTDLGIWIKNELRHALVPGFVKNTFGNTHARNAFL